MTEAAAAAAAAASTITVLSILLGFSLLLNIALLINRFVYRGRRNRPLRVQTDPDAPPVYIAPIRPPVPLRKPGDITGGQHAPPTPCAHARTPVPLAKPAAPSTTTIVRITM